MKFKYKDKVKVTDSFYGVVEGVVEDYNINFFLGSPITPYYTYKVNFKHFVPSHDFLEDQLERIEEE